MATIRYRSDPAKPARLTEAQHRRLERMTPAEIETNARDDADSPPLTEAEIKTAWKPKLLRELRERLGLSQGAFAASYQISVRTLQDWEQGRRVPDQVARSFLRVIAREPAMVKAALKAA